MPRPVADSVVATLASRPDEVARRWLIALLEGAPLAAAAAVPVGALAAEGPVLCAAVLRAVRSDEALETLVDPASDPPATDIARLSGARDAPAVVSAAEALRRAVLQSAAAEVAHADASVLAVLGDRVAHVCARTAAQALDRRAFHGTELGPSPEADGAEEATARSASEPGGASAGNAPPGGAPSGGAPPGGASAPAERAAAPLWLAALDRQIAGGGRFALLLVEVDGADHLRLAEGEEVARDLFSQAGRAVRGRVRRADLLAHEEDGRMWLIAPDAGREGGDALGVRVAGAVEGAAASRSAPLTASVGIALFPDDGRDAAALTGHAEEGVYAARAAGTRVAGPSGDDPALHRPRLVR